MFHIGTLNKVFTISLYALLIIFNVHFIIKTDRVAQTVT